MLMQYNEKFNGKLNFYKLIPYLVDKGTPTLPSLLFTHRGNYKGRKQKEEVQMRAHVQQTGRGLQSHLAIEQDTTGPGQSPAQDVFF